MLRILIAGLMATTLVGSAQAQTASTAEIVVMGSGSIERPADWAGISLSASGEGKTSVDALRNLTALQTRLETKLSALAGASSSRVETGELKVTPIRGKDCNSGERYRPVPVLSDGACAIVGYVASLSMTVKVAPAARVGDAASLAAELGGADVELSGSGLDARNALKEAAAQAAIDDARAQASAIAKASGVKLGPILRVQDPETMDYAGGYAGLARLQPRPAAAAYEVAPAVAVSLTVPPVRENARLMVVFSILP